MPLVLQPLKKKSLIDQEVVSKLAKELKISRLFAELLYNRGYDTAERCRQFLFPDESSLNDPFLLKNMKEAVRAIKEVILQNQQITVYGDYDVDGICATALLYSILKEMGASVTYYLPDRHTEGYGLNASAIDTIVDSGTALLITVDCGISAFPEIEHAKERGLEVVVTDHHALPEQLPDCIIVNPLQEDDAYPFKRLCGAGIALKLAEALCGKEKALTYTDLAAIATIADIVPLLEENRTIVKKGLELLNRTPRKGVAALLENAGITQGELNAYHVAFMLAPRLNAAGRLENAERALQLMLDEGEEHKLIALELTALNAARQETEKQILKEAIEIIEQEEILRNYKVLVVAKEGWEEGVIGICASRLAERYNRPCVLFSIKEGMAKGSGRSIAGVDLFSMLCEAKHMFRKFGGHEMAAGMSMEAELLPDLQEVLEGTINDNYPSRLFLPVAGYDAKAKLYEMDELLCKNLELLAPTGFGNSAPLFRLDDVSLSNIVKMGKENNHIRLNVADGPNKLSAVAFHYRRHTIDYFNAQKATLIVSPQINEWKGEKSVNLKISAAKENRDIDACKELLKSHREDLIRTLFSQFTYNAVTDNTLEDILDNTEFMDDAQEFAAQLLEMLEDDIAGTLVLCSEPEIAEKVISILLNGAPRCDICFFSPIDNIIGYNSFVIAPSLELLDFKLYKHIIICDAYTLGYISYLGKTAPWASLLAFDMRGIHDFSTIEKKYKDFSRERFASAYKVLKELNTSKPFGSKKEFIDFICAVDSTLSKPIMEIAISVFTELNFFSISNENGYSIKLSAEVKQTPLENSNTYKNVTAFIK